MNYTIFIFLDDSFNDFMLLQIINNKNKNFRFYHIQCFMRQII